MVTSAANTNIQFQERYSSLSYPLALTKTTTAHKTKIRTLLRELSNDEEDNHTASSPSTLEDDPSRPWLRDFRAYLDTTEHVPEGWTAIVWWGVSA